MKRLKNLECLLDLISQRYTGKSFVGNSFPAMKRNVLTLVFAQLSRLHSVFLTHCVEPKQTMSRQEFMEVDCIARNPLKQQICACFDLHGKNIVYNLSCITSSMCAL